MGNDFVKKLSATVKVYLLLLVCVALLAPVIANRLPLYVFYNNAYYFPAFNPDGGVSDFELKENFCPFKDIDFDKLPEATIIYPIIRYSPGQSDFRIASYTSPLEKQILLRESGTAQLKWSERHWLGTGKRGDDVLAGIIHGSRVSLTVGLLSMLLAGSIGIIAGLASGYFGDHRLKFSMFSLIALLVFLLPAWFYADVVSNILIETAPLLFRILAFTVVFLMILVFAIGCCNFLEKQISKSNKAFAFPIDSIIVKIIELVSSLPTLLLILAIAAITQPSLTNLIWIIGITSWTEIARLTRAEVLKVRSKEYVESAQASGMRTTRLILYHILPNCLTPVIVAMVFGTGSAILAESGLSFLGIGIPPETVSWGKLIAAGRQEMSAWWLVIFPGIMITLTVLSLQSVANTLRNMRRA